MLEYSVNVKPGFYFLKVRLYFLKLRFDKGVWKRAMDPGLLGLKPKLEFCSYT